MDRLLAMQAFARVVEAGTFTRAADLLALPKPTVTRLIQMLEAHLQVRLLNRTTRRVSATPEGAAYYDRVVRVLGDVEEMESSLVRAKASPRGRLRVEVGASVAHMLLIPALADFQRQYPDLHIDLGVSDRRVDLVGDNLDCVVQSGEVEDQSMVARHVGDFHLILCASPDYLKRHGVPRHPLDLERGHVVVHSDPRAGRPSAFGFTKDGEHHDIRSPHRLSVNDSNAALAAGLHGMGIVRTATVMAHPYIESGRLQTLLPDWCTDALPVHVVYPPNRHQSARLRVFVDWVAALFARSDLMHRRCCAARPTHGPGAIAAPPPREAERHAESLVAA